MNTSIVRAIALAAIAVFVGTMGSGNAQTQPAAAANGALLQRYCVGCHNNQMKTAGVTLQGVDLTGVGDKAELLEKVLHNW